MFEKKSGKSAAIGSAGARKDARPLVTFSDKISATTPLVPARCSRTVAAALEARDRAIASRLDVLVRGGGGDGARRDVRDQD